MRVRPPVRKPSMPEAYEKGVVFTIDWLSDLMKILFKAVGGELYTRHKFTDRMEK
ncbi:hypothetical protein SERLA73DRAFT_133199 [Serpula lacrymans var. lacrymans S7.3]|uniref:Uncharacterized protein n=2 Tax=Serpula lacrymans var. lacrymans TaxID=341189 RepID=F8PQS8_SERL3|nr:uncharacterized protein SERLADRAFT_383931 [Serpula lacrymans var. lacrymans S7.9]EGO02272.1 hypothetical protein SERLA73DRAFT_133199 [Serpula lacrymans var. lacrymans S7.3]EGO28016.1 hypothetical protein SERLADRAFT_383931 [Serpula lacrymans var. lacrymans S7.9]